MILRVRLLIAVAALLILAAPVAGYFQIPPSPVAALGLLMPCAFAWAFALWRATRRPPAPPHRRRYLDLLCRADITWLWAYGSLTLFEVLAVAVVIAVIFRITHP